MSCPVLLQAVFCSAAIRIGTSLGKIVETFRSDHVGMIRSTLLAVLCFVPCLALARALPAASIPAPSALCRAAILQAERATHVPDRLLDAIAVVESGRRDPISGAVYPWPWTINAEGVGHFYESKAEAVAAVQDFQAHGIRSMDVGCMQVNLMYHPDAFATLDQAFDPMTNAAYGARFLQQLYSQTNAWPLAVAAYHSFTPDLGADYARKVLAAWGVPLLPVGSQIVTAAVAGAAQVAQVASLAPASPPGRVAVLLPNGNEAIRVLPLAGRPTMAAGAPGAGGPGLGAPVVAARGLDSYRATPITFTTRPGRAS